MKRRMKAIDALRLAVERERGALNFYRDAARMDENPDGRRMFHWLAKEEARHLIRLRGQLNALLDNSRWTRCDRTDFASARSDFPSVSEASGPVSRRAAEREALAKAVESEKEAVTFYRYVEEATPDLNGKSMFRLLAEEEQRHIELLERELEWFAKAHGEIAEHEVYGRSIDA